MGVIFDKQHDVKVITIEKIRPREGHINELTNH